MRLLVFMLSLALIGCADNGTDPVTASNEPSQSTEGGTATTPRSPADRTVDDTTAEPLANAGNVTIARPADGSVLGENPIRVAGTARTFENNVVLEVLDEDGAQIMQTATTARGELGEFNPWEAELWLTRWPGETLSVRAIEHSMKDGSIRSMETVTLRNGTERREITIHLPNTSRSPNDCSVVYPVVHVVPGSVGMARLLTETVMAGPTPLEQGQGFSGAFPKGARVNSIALDATTVTIDFSPEMQNVGGSCRVQAIRASLEATLKQLPNVDRVRITAGGSEELALQP